MTHRVQIDDVVRDATSEEENRIATIAEAHRQRMAEIEAQATAKASAKAKLAALGLTDAEIAALLGA